MSPPIRLLPEAKAEFDAAADWYESKRAGLGQDFIRRVGEVFTGIAANPRLHAKLIEKFEWQSSGNFLMSSSIKKSAMTFW
jgi:hypothetical protein